MTGGREARGRVLTAGMSADLIAAFAMVSEATTADGDFKFQRAVCRGLARAIVCRAYANPVYQLCHLINAADACGHGHERFEWLFFADGRLNARYFRGTLGHAAASRGWRRPGFSITDNGVAIEYADGVFNVPFTRMPLLAAMFEFLVSVVRYADIDDAVTEMFADASGMAAVSATANALQRALYAYLSDNLSSAQERDKFSVLIEFLEDRGDGASIVIDDAAVLDFWHRPPGDDAATGDFRAYRTVFEGFTDLMRTLDVAETRFAVENANPIGADPESGEIDVEDLELLVAAVGEWRSPLGILEDGPASRIKMLNLTELGYVRTLCDCGPLSARLPVSLLRCECFGAAQARLTQALRKNPGRDRLAELVDCQGAETYGERQSGYAEMRAHIERVLKAAAYATFRERMVAASDNVVMLHAREPVAAMEGDVDGDLAVSDDEMGDAMEDARRAFARISRRGFSDDDLDDDETVEGFALGAGALLAIDDLIAGFVDRLDRLDGDNPDLAARFAADKNIFREQFAELYGDQQ